MWRNLLARWRKRPTTVASSLPPAEPALLLPGSHDRPFPALVAILEAYSGAAERPDVLLFGDSVMERVSRHDVDRRDLGACVAASLSELSILKISHSAFNPAVYAALARVVARLPNRPTLTIVPINLRCFSPQWDLHPAWQFAEEIACVDAWLNDRSAPIRPLREIRDTPGLLAPYDAARVRYPLSQLRTVGEFRDLVRELPADQAARDARAREIFIFHYTHPLVQGHRRLAALREALEILSAAGSRTVVYITPINHQAGARLVSEAFTSSLRRNIQVVRAMLEACGVQLLDWSEILAADCFFHDDLATEHLNETGRAVLAVRIADAVRAAAK